MHNFGRVAIPSCFYVYKAYIFSVPRCSNGLNSSLKESDFDQSILETKFQMSALHFRIYLIEKKFPFPFPYTPSALIPSVSFLSPLPQRTLPVVFSLKKRRTYMPAFSMVIFSFHFLTIVSMNSNFLCVSLR